MPRGTAGDFPEASRVVACALRSIGEQRERSAQISIPGLWQRLSLRRPEANGARCRNFLLRMPLLLSCVVSRHSSRYGATMHA
jgi:hypothetical protein